MTPRPLQLKRCAAPVREAAAWFLAGDDPAAWLAELCRCGAAQEKLRLFLVPRAAEDRSAAGLLVMGGAATETMRALALGVIGERLYLPVDAEFHPPVTAAEATALCRAAVTLFHPGLGLVEFDADEALSVADLLAAPMLTATNWNVARASMPLVSRLTGVALVGLPTMDELFGDAPREIGAEPPTELPPLPNEPSAGPGSQLGRALGTWGASALAKVVSWLPTSRHRTWVNQVMDWATAKITTISSEMEELRNRELNRLLHLLDNDPELGLRHALALGGPPGRGRAAPGGKLGLRDPHFDRRCLGGGRPADSWSVPRQLREKLAARYRELALREQQLGRWKRAAYIHAELLGDLSAAAAVLREGRHSVDAAVLYRDHLGQPRVAAECFVEAGLIAEAAALYEKELAWIELGEMHRRLGDAAAAETAFRRAVEEKIAALDFIAAATLLEDRVGASDEALALLRKGWPDSPQAGRCLAAEFDLLGRLARHDAGGRRLTNLSAEATPALLAVPLVDVLITLFEKYPDLAIRHRAGDLARVKLSSRLAVGSLDEVKAGLLRLPRLAPGDLLLGCDASRFLAVRSTATKPPPLPAPRQPGSGRLGAPELVRTFRLPACDTLLAARRCGSHFFAVIRKKKKNVFARGDWQGVVQTTGADDREFHRLALAVDEHAGHPERVAVLVHPVALIAEHFAATDQFRDLLRIGCRAWLPDDTLALSLSGGEWWLLRGTPVAPVLEIRSDDGRVTGSFDLTVPLNEVGNEVQHISMQVLRGQSWIAFDHQLILLDRGKVVGSWRCESPILGLEVSARFLPRGIVARCVAGAAIFWADHPHETVEMLASELHAPRAAFLGDGTLVLLSSVPAFGVFEGEVIHIDRRGRHRSATFEWKAAHPPVAVVATDRPNEFATFTQAGEVHVHRVSAK